MPLAIICYDISDNRRRYKVARELANYGTRVQRSVFELVEDGDTLDRVFAVVRDLIDPGEDSLRMYVLCQSCRARTVSAGCGKGCHLEREYYIA